MIRSLDLDPLFKPTAHTQVKFNMFKFPGGEQHIKLQLDNISYQEIKKIVITHRIKTGDDLIQIMIAKDACETMGVKNFDLIIPYTPYARQDRVAVEGESFTLKVFANAINSLGFDKVYVVDAHSNVAPALIDRCTNLSNEEYVERAVKDILKSTNSTQLFLAAPDYGASKKVHELASKIEEVVGVIQCEKARDVKTGELSGFKVHIPEMTWNRPVLVVDDICDGGGSFMGLAKEMPEDNLHLFVTHGIFSKGIGTLLEYYEHIYTTNSYQTFNVIDVMLFTQYPLYI